MLVNFIVTHVGRRMLKIYLNQEEQRKAKKSEQGLNRAVFSGRQSVRIRSAVCHIRNPSKGVVDPDWL